MPLNGADLFYKVGETKNTNIEELRGASQPFSQDFKTEGPAVRLSG